MGDGDDGQAGLDVGDALDILDLVLGGVTLLVLTDLAWEQDQACAVGL